MKKISIFKSLKTDMKSSSIAVVLAALVALQFIGAQMLRADEGMWLPALISQRIADMQAKGLKLSAEDIYSVNKASLKDAVMLFGADVPESWFQLRDCCLPITTAVTATFNATLA